MNVHHQTLDARSAASALGGEVAGPYKVLAPGPNHSPQDRSLSVTIDPDAPGGFRVNSFANDDWRECRDYVAEKLGQPRWEPKGKKEDRRGRALAEYIYRDQDGAPYLKVVRFPNKPGGKKDIRQMRWNGRDWEWGKPRGPKIPYRLPEILRTPNSPILVAEGEKDADNLARLGLLGTSASEGAGKWTPELGKWFKGRTVYVLPDNDDPGRKHARQVAENLHGIAREVRIVALPSLPEKGGDVSDRIAADGDVEELLRLCEAAPLWAPESEPAPEAPLRILSNDEMLALPEPRWLVKTLLMGSTSALLFGKSNSFKSFLAIDVGCSVSTGRTWHGCEITEPGPVLYVATEGALGVAKQRIPGWMEAHQIPEAERRNIYLYPQEIALDDDAAVEALLASCAIKRRQQGPDRAFRLVIVDIFGASMMGLETSDETARAWVRNVNRILRDMGCAVLVVAHTGWADETRAGMHTHFWGSFDTRLKAEGNKEQRTTVLTVDRHKDADSDGRWGFQLDSVTLPHGKTTLYPRLSDEVETGQRKHVTGKAALALQALSEALIDHGRTLTGPSYPACPVVSIEHWRVMCDRHGLTDSDSPEAARKAFNRARTTLIEKGLVRQFDDLVWKVPAHG